MQDLLCRLAGTIHEARRAVSYGLLDWLPKRRALTQETPRLLAEGGAEAISRRESDDFRRWLDGLPTRDVKASNRRSAGRLAVEAVITERRAAAERRAAERRAAAKKIVAERRAAAERVVAERRATAERVIAESRAAQRRAARVASRQRRRVREHTGKTACTSKRPIPANAS